MSDEIPQDEPDWFREVRESLMQIKQQVDEILAEIRLMKAIAKSIK